MKFFQFSLLFNICLNLNLFSQRYDHVWIDPTRDDIGKQMVWSFDSTFVKTKIETNRFISFDANLTISDHEGNPLFFTNGNSIYKMDGTFITNGEDIVQGFDIGSPLTNQLVSIPDPKSDHNFYLFYLGLYSDDFNNQVYGWQYAKIINLHTINPSVQYKKRILIPNPQNYSSSVLPFCFAAPVKHANGRDWWLVLPSVYNESRDYYITLIDSDTVYTPNLQTIQHGFQYGACPLSEAHFSRDGKKFISYNNADGVLLFDFDRCNGILFNEKFNDLQIGNVATSWSAPTSPSGRYLYFSPWDGMQKAYLCRMDLNKIDEFYPVDTLYQFDTVAVDESCWAFCKPTTSSFRKLAPDGRIYQIIRGGYHRLYYLPFPDKINVPNPFRYVNLDEDYCFFRGVSYYPNYRLGPIDGSPCDTLGLDNLPLAGFRWDLEDTLQPLTVTFTDNSFYEPVTWYWNFGGTGISQDTSPVFTFPAPGIYQVCQIVCNVNACDTVCYDVPVGLPSSGTNTSPITKENTFSLFPNPIYEGAPITIMLKNREFDLSNYQINIFDILGTTVFSENLLGNSSTIQIKPFLQKGVYLVSFSHLFENRNTEASILIIH